MSAGPAIDPYFPVLAQIENAGYVPTPSPEVVANLADCDQLIEI
jgi:hypothetical protein